MYIRVSAISPTNCIIVPFRLLNEMYCLAHFYVINIYVVLPAYVLKCKKRRSDSNQTNLINTTKLGVSLI